MKKPEKHMQINYNWKTIVASANDPRNGYYQERILQSGYTDLRGLIVGAHPSNVADYVRIFFYPLLYNLFMNEFDPKVRALTEKFDAELQELRNQWNGIPQDYFERHSKEREAIFEEMRSWALDQLETQWNYD